MLCPLNRHLWHIQPADCARVSSAILTMHWNPDCLASAGQCKYERIRNKQCTEIYALDAFYVLQILPNKSTVNIRNYFD